MASGYRDWRYAPRDQVRARRVEQFRQNAAQTAFQRNRESWFVSDSSVRDLDRSLSDDDKEPAREKPKKKSGGGIFGKLKDVAGDVGGGALDVLGAGQKYVGAPLFGVASGLTEAKVYADPETGRRYRKTASFADVGRGLFDAATQDPRKTYREGKQASEEYLADPDKSAGHRFAAGAVMDPLTYIGPGALKKVGLAAGGRAGRIAQGLIESPRRAAGGAILAGAGASEGAERAGFGVTGQTVAGLTGAVAGGGLAGSTGARRASQRAGRELTEGRLSGERGSLILGQPFEDDFAEALGRNGIDFRFDDSGRYVVDDPEAALAIAERMESAAAWKLAGTATPGGTGNRSTKHFGDMDPPKAGRKGPGRGAHRILPKVDLEALRDLEDAERIRDVLSVEAVDTGAVEVPRRPLVPGSRMKGAQREGASYRVLEQQWDASTGPWKNSTEGRAVGEQLARDDAFQFVHGLIDEGITPRGLALAIGTHIEERGFTVGRKNLDLRERAYRRTLNELSDRVAVRGADEVYTPGDAGEAARRGPGSGASGLSEAGAGARAGVGGEAQAAGTAGRIRAELTDGSSEQPTFHGMEPPPPRVPPTPPESPPNRGSGGTRAFGSKAPRDLLHTQSRATVIEDAQTRRAGPVASLRRAFGFAEDETTRTKVKPFLGREKNRMEARLGHVAEAMVDRERRVLGASGIEVSLGENGYYHMVVAGEDLGYFDDIVERTSDAGRAAYERLDETKRAALEVIEDHNAEMNGTMQFHGVEPRIDPAIEGAYFGRRVTGKQYEGMGGTVRMDKLQGTGQSRKVGADRIKSRTVENVEALEKRGYTTENPWVARLAITRGKLMMAEDGYLAGALKPLRVKNAGSGFGYQQVTGHPAFNNQWFEEPVAKAIQKGLDPSRKIPGFDRVNSVLTPLRAAFDTSGALQQGARFWLTNPKDGAGYWMAATRSLGDSKIYDNVLNKLDADGPGIVYQAEHGLRFTGETASDELMFGMTSKGGVAGKVANKAFEKSNQWFGRPLNAYRLHMANATYKRFADSGLSGDELDDAMMVANRGINRMFGIGDAKPTSIEDAALFAPRYFKASIETVLNAVPGVAKTGIEGAQARRHIGLLVAESAMISWLLNEARGYTTDFDPRSDNFLRIRNVGGLDVSPLGTYGTLIRALAIGAAGSDFSQDGPVKDRYSALRKFGWAKLSPGAKLLYEPIVEHSTYLGEPLDPLGDPFGFLVEEGKSSLPFSAQNLIEEGPVAAAVGFAGVSNTLVNPAEKRDFAREDVAKDLFGQDYDGLSGAEKSIVNEDERVAKHIEEARRNTQTKGGTRGEYARTVGGLRDQLEALTVELEGGEVTGNKFRERYGEIQQSLRDAANNFGIEFSGDDEDLDGWFGLYDRAKTRSGRIDFDELERLQEAYIGEHPDIEEKVLKEVGANDNAVLQQFREARKLSREYYEIPAYLGMNAEDGGHASEVLAAASDMVAFGQAVNRNHALALMRKLDPSGVRLAFRAASLPSNPRRKAFRRANPLMARFYSDIAGELAA